MKDKKKIYTVRIKISEYNEPDGGFYSLKEDLEVAKGKEQLLKSIEIIKKNIVDYTNRRIS